MAKIKKCLKIPRWSSEPIDLRATTMHRPSERGNKTNNGRQHNILKSKDFSNPNLSKTGSELMCSDNVSGSCSTSDNNGNKPVIS